MIPPALRLTALAALAALSLPAAASTDASFAAVLGQAPAGLAVMAQLKTQPQRPAAATQAQGPTAPAEAWKKILDEVARDGVKGADGDFFTQTLTVFRGDLKLGYESHRVTVSSFLDANRSLRVAGVEFTRRIGTHYLLYDSVITDDWDILADSSGKVRHAIYTQDLYTPKAGTNPGTPMVVDLADPRVKANFDQMLKFWSTR